MITALKGKILVGPILHSKMRADDTEKRSGLIVPKPSNKLYDFEGIPNVGTVEVLPKDYDGVLNIGDRVVFNDLKPLGIKYDGKKYLMLEMENVIAIIGGE